MSPSVRAFRSLVWDFYARHARRMPWRVNRTPYRVFVSEIMLQQTSVARVTPRFAGFVRALPSFRRLAEANVQQVIGAWTGLGYNRRALALHESARQIVTEHHGRLPRSVDELVRLPGVGQATASAVIVYAYDTPCVFIETNIRRVFLHHFFRGRRDVPDSLVLPLVEKTLDEDRPREWYYALMDYGAALAANGQNANRRSRNYKVQSRFEGSMRQLRGRILSALVDQGDMSVRQIVSHLGRDARLGEALSRLTAEGFLRVRGDRYSFR